MLRVLAAAEGHLTATEVHQQVLAAGWPADATAIYHSLGAFIDYGLVHVLPAPGPTAYGLADPRITTRCAPAATASPRSPRTR